MRDDRGIDIPNLGELLNVLFVLPVAKSGQISISAGFSRILRRRLSVHLQDPAARLPDHAAYKIDVVDLDCGSCRLVRLVDALKTSADQTFCLADQAGGCFDLLCWDARNRGTTLGRILGNDLLELFEADRVFLNEPLVDPSLSDNHVQDSVEQRNVGPETWREVDIGFLCSRRLAGINHNQLRGIRAPPPVENAHPKDGVGAGDIVADVYDAFRLVDIEIAAGLPIGSKGLLEGCRRCCRA